MNPSAANLSERGKPAEVPRKLTFRPGLLTAFERIDEFAGLGPGWNGVGAPQLPGLVISRAALLMLRVAEFDIVNESFAVPTTSAPIADGGLQLEWEVEGTRIEVQVAPDGTFGYLLIHLDQEPISVEADDDLNLDEIVELVQSVICL